MPLKRLTKFFFGPAPDLTREQAMKVFKRDLFKCQYCGLDGLHAFENWLVLTIDFVHPRARGGSLKMDNMVAACRPCNIMKGKRMFASREEAKKYVLEKRAGWHQKYQEQIKSVLPEQAAS